MRNTYTNLLGLFTLLFFLPLLVLVGRSTLTGFRRIDENAYIDTLANPVTLLGGLLAALWILLKLTTGDQPSSGQNDQET
ncbi:hypothetical protein [Salinifilum ghardaiensis]